MYKNIKKKIIRTFERLTNFIKDNLARAVAIILLFLFFEFSKTLPYINIIPNYQFLYVGFLIFLSMVLFRVSIPNRNIVFAVVALFIIAALVTIFDTSSPLADLIGFIVFVLVLFMTLRQIITDREDLKKSDLE